VPVRLKSRIRSWLEDQRGLSLIEILGAVTIMSIISVTLMGYFITGLNKSEEQSRRIIAVNLARLKAAEIRQDVKKSSDYSDMLSNNSSSSPQIYNSVRGIGSGAVSLSDLPVNGTTYHYRVSLDSQLNTSTTAGRRNLTLKEPPMNAMTTPDEYLIPMTITVYWDNDTGINILPAKSTAIDTYVVNRGEE
jgi:Tfp pilus assembly protein PilV